MDKEEYFVASEIDQPVKIFFNREVAFEGLLYEYIDSFDDQGFPLKSYKLVNGSYTTDF
jgi:hypothetical protein